VFILYAGHVDLCGVRAVGWGREQEAAAIRSFSEKSGQRVTTCGIFLHKSGILAASPDGLVGSNAVVEVKCPYKYRDDPNFARALIDSSFCLQYVSDRVCLKPNIRYYHQIQGQMHICGRREAYLVVYIPADTLIVHVAFDAAWATYIPIMCDFC
jgi:hypothetical protein